MEQPTVQQPVPLSKQSAKNVLPKFFFLGSPDELTFFAPLLPLKSSALLPQVEYLKKLGYTRLRIDGEMLDTETEKPPQIPSGRLVQIDVLIDRLTPSHEERSRLLQSIGEACRLSKDKVLVVREGIEKLFNLMFAVEETGESFPEITPLTFSFSSPHGMCEECQALGVLIESFDDEYDLEADMLCPACHGERLNPLGRAVTLASKSLPDLCALPMSTLVFLARRS